MLALDLLLQLTRGQVTGRDVACQRQCHVAIAVQRELTGQVGVPEYDDLEPVARADAVAAGTGAVLRDLAAPGGP